MDPGALREYHYSVHSLYPIQIDVEMVHCGMRPTFSKRAVIHDRRRSKPNVVAQIGVILCHAFNSDPKPIRWTRAKCSHAFPLN